MSGARRPWSAVRVWEDALSPIRSAPWSLQEPLEEFADWMRHHRGLQPATVENRLSYVRNFLRTEVKGAGPYEMTELTPVSVESYFMKYAATAGDASRRGMRASLRLFLRFSGERGWVAPTLLQAVPTIRKYRLAGVVRGIEDEQIRRLLESLSGGTPADIRAHAILLILATYGVRRGQVCALRLEDIHWRARRIVFREHKAGKSVEHELSAPVARALERYICQVRPRVEHPEVFLRLLAPILPLGGGAVTELVRRALHRAGIATTSSGAHVFRHAFATRQLREGRSLKVIADLLGHRSLTSTAIYTKVDQPGLREVAIAWPAVLR